MLSAVIASLPGAVYRSELQEPWRTTFLSEGFRRCWTATRTPSWRAKCSGTEFVHPDDLHPSLGEDIDRDLAAGSPTTESEYRILTADGEVTLGARPGDVRPRRGGRARRADRHAVRRDRPARGARRHGRERAPAAHRHRQHPRHGVPLPGRRAVERRVHRRRRRELDRLLRRGAHRPRLPLGPGHAPRGRAACSRRRHAIGAETGRGQTEYRIRAKDGAERWLLDRFTFLKDEQRRACWRRRASSSTSPTSTGSRTSCGPLAASSSCTRASPPSSSRPRRTGCSRTSWALSGMPWVRGGVSSATSMRTAPWWPPTWTRRSGTPAGSRASRCGSRRRRGPTTPGRAPSARDAPSR